MLKKLLQRWADWTGDHSLLLAIQRELRRQGLAVRSAHTRNVRLIAIQRPGWVQVHSFQVETRDAEQQPVTLLGLARDDGRQERIEVLLTACETEFHVKREEWSEGLIRRR